MQLILVLFALIITQIATPLPSEAGGSKREKIRVNHRKSAPLDPVEHYNFLPKEVQCQHASDCRAIQAVCGGWEYVHEAFASKRESLNILRRRHQECVVDVDTMPTAPEPACFLHVCVNSNAVKKRGSDCKMRQNYVDYFHSLARSCETDTDCSRGLAHCGFDCTPSLFNRKAATFLGKWIDSYAAHCESCQEFCLDKYADQMPSNMIRCKMGRCILMPKRQIKMGVKRQIDIGVKGR